VARRAVHSIEPAPARVSGKTEIMETGIECRSGPFLVNLFSFCQKFSKPASLPPRAADVAINLVERDAGSASHVWQPKNFPGHLPPRAVISKVRLKSSTVM